VTPRLAAWIARQHRRACALDALSDMGVDVELVRFVRWLVTTGRLNERIEP
jgi:hypothetical protein